MFRFVFTFAILLFWSSISFCQPVPSNPLLWIGADSGVTVNSGTVSSWSDRSSHHFQLVQVSTTHQPIVVTQAYNNLPAIRFSGYQCLIGPPVFPRQSDYTICVVVQIQDTTVINNVLSGESHAFWLNSNSYPGVLHNNEFGQQAISSAGVHSGLNVMTVGYSKDTWQARFYVNGQFGDSMYVPMNNDSTLYLGSYIGGYFLHGDVTELLLYDRELNDSERTQMERYLTTKYAIPAPPSLLSRDTTFSTIPRFLQLFPRDSDDSARVSIAGFFRKPGFDSMYVKVTRNGSGYLYLSQPLQYVDGAATFSFSPAIHAELSEYSFTVGLKSTTKDSVLRVCDSIVCGDVFLIDGQSNAVFGYDNPTYTNEFCRTFGIHSSQNLRDTVWALSLASKWGDGPSVSAWGQRIQRDLVEREQIPSCCINGGESGTSIGSHLRNDTDKFNLRTIYGRQLYRATKAGLNRAVNVMFWDQGELNYAAGYYGQFRQLFSSWKEDYPNLKKIYLMQIRPNFCGWGNIDLRDVQRSMGDSIGEGEPISTAALPYQDGCHYYDLGCDKKGDRLFASFARDFYHATDTVDLRSPNATGAYFTSPAHTTLAVIFSPPFVRLSSTPDTTAGGALETLKDYLYLDDSTRVTSVRFDMDTLFLDLEKSSAARSLGYLPDQYYNNDSVIYEGPWIVNSRGLGALLFHNLPISSSLLSVRNESTEHPEFSFFPDPAHDKLMLDTRQLSSPSKITIVNENGEVLMKKIVQFDQESIVSLDIRSIPAGRYVVEATSSAARKTRKIVIQHQ